MMVENGGELTVGQRLGRIEDEIRATKNEVSSVKEHVDERITRHRVANQKQIRELAEGVVNALTDRVATLEKHDVAEDAVRSYRKWLIGIGVVVVFGIVANFIAMMQLMGRA